MVKQRYKHWLPRLLGINAITWNMTIYYSNSEGNTPPWLYNHEMAHVNQYRVYGITRFLLTYMVEYCWNRLKGLDSLEAYRQISFEKEARKAERGD